MPKNMLGVALCDYRGPQDDLIAKLTGEDGEIWLAEFKKFLRGEPCWVKEMIYTPLEWSHDFGEVAKLSLADQARSYRKQNGEDWRLPTRSELRRALKIMKPDGFVLWKYYWTSTPCGNEVRHCFEVLRTHDGKGGLGGCSDESMCNQDQKYPHLRLCREVIPIAPKVREAIGNVNIGTTVKCSGDPVSHQCEKRKCPHRLPHTFRGCCGSNDQKENTTHWCTCPGTVSLLEIGEDGSVETCVPV